MNIHNIFLGGKGIQQINSRKTGDAPESGKSDSVDTVSISGDIGDKGDTTIFSVNSEYPPRMDRIEAVSAKITAGEYNAGLIEQVAGSLVDSPVVQDVMTEVAMNRMMDTEDSADEIANVRENARQGYYDDPGVKREIADRLLTALGFGGDEDSTL